MECWKEIFKDIIEKDDYQINLTNGELNGLNIEFIGKKSFILKFGLVHAIRIFDEGIVQNGVYSDKEIQKYKKNRFCNIIYEVEDGQFFNEVKYIADEYWGILNIKHYIIITNNYNIDILTEYEPDICFL